MRCVFSFVALAVVLACGGCAREFHQFDYIPPYMVKAPPPPPPDAPGRSHNPYTGIPKYLAEARPLRATNDVAREAPAECAAQSTVCDDRLRAVLATIDGQILALSTPPTELQMTALKLATAQLAPLLVPYPDMMAERDELVAAVANFSALTLIDQALSRRRLTELTDLIRVQLAAAH
jgi:hypothetical protein